MIPLNEFGYRSRAAFLRDESPSPSVFEAMSRSEFWCVQKSVLLHEKCPIEIRERFAKDRDWYKRFVAYFTKNAPKDFWRKAETDSHYYIQRVYNIWYKTWTKNLTS